MPNRFVDLIPDQRLDLRSLPRGQAKTNALEEAYKSGFCGAFTTHDSYPLGPASIWCRDEFRATAGRNQCMFTQMSFDGPASSDAEYGYIASSDAARMFKRDKASDAIDWLFRVDQNRGSCVQASWTEMGQGMQGTRVADPANGEAFKYLMGWWQYAFRGSCGSGWWGSTCASVTVEHGYCFALPLILDKYQFAGENDAEKYCDLTWCRNGPPTEMREFVDQRGWRFESGAITEFDGDVSALKALGQQKGQFHHGSNVTSGSHKPNVLTRIGGHQQTMFGISWHPLLLAFYESKGLTLDASDAWTFNHQSWGPGFSGECGDEYWPYGHDGSKAYSLADIKSMPAEKVASLTLLAGDRPEGAWVCSASKLLNYVEGYAYLPRFKGWPSDTPTPVPVPTPITVTGSLFGDVPTPIRGVISVTCGDAIEQFIAVPAGQAGRYEFVRKQN